MDETNIKHPLLRSEDTEPGAIATAFNMVGINAGRVRSLSLPVLYPPKGAKKFPRRFP